MINEYTGHNYIYAVEQAVATHMPGEKVKTRLSKGKKWTTASCDYKGFKGYARCKTEDLDDKKAQYILKTAIYKAALASGKNKAPWGTVTGVRPGKLMRQIMDVDAFSKAYDTERDRAQLAYDTSLYTIEAENSLHEDDICLYVGIPFCPTRCAYCSFVSQSVEKSMKLIEPFFDALLKEVEATGAQAKDKNVVSIYFGGGTPTTLSAEMLDKLILSLEKNFNLARLTEFCVEAGRPDTITKEKLDVLKAHKVNRISVNPQTMNDRVLEAIGRHHTAQDIVDAVKLAEGFDINMDLIAGLPTDTLESFRQTVDKVIELNPANITIHTLSLKKGSNLIKNPEDLPSSVGEMLDYAYEKLKKYGYEPYYLYRQKNMQGGFENTGWTKKGHKNLYNICMMEELCTVLAMGAGGSSKLIRPSGRNERIVTPKYPLEYIEHIEKICKDKEKICTT